MGKTIIRKIFALCLAFSMISLISLTPSAQAVWHVSVNWGSLYHPTQWDPSPTWYETYELPEHSEVCGYITTLVDFGYAGEDYVAANNFGEDTTTTYVYENSAAIEYYSYYDFLATFHVGDMYPADYSGERHYAYYTDSAYNGVEDDPLYDYTGNKHYFTFIYTCVNGGLIDTDDDGDLDCYGYNGNYGIVGMPYAWTHRTNLSWDGYWSPDYSGYAYIGFENISQWMCNNGEFYQWTNCNYAGFVELFYYYTLADHENVGASLDWAMYDATSGNKWYYDSWLYNGYWAYDSAHDISAWSRMVVLGDSTMFLAMDQEADEF